jgi:TolA-binding protein
VNSRVRDILQPFGIILIACLMCPAIAASVKPFLDVDDVILETSPPALTGGRKDAIRVLDVQTSVSSVSETLMRLDSIVPNLIPAPNQPQLETQGGCIAPFLKFGSGTKSLMIRASQAWDAMRWNDVSELLKPVVNHKDAIPEKPAALYFTGRSRHYLGDNSGAEEAYENLVKQYPDNTYTEFALYSLAWIYFENDNIEKALDSVNELDLRFAASPLSPYLRYLRAAILNKQGKYQESLRSLEGIIAGYPLFANLPDVQYWIAENNFSLEQYLEAESSYSLYLSNYPDGKRRAEAYYGRAFARLELKHFSDALNDIASLVNQFPEHDLSGHGGFLGGKLSIFLGDYERAAKFFYDVLSSYPSNSPKFLEAQAWIEYTGDRYDSAAEMFRNAATAYSETLDRTGDVSGNRDEMLFFEAVSYMQNEDFLSAATKFEALANRDLSVWRGSSLARAGICRMKLNQPDLALDHLTSALNDEYPPRNKHLYTLYKAEILYRTANYEDSIALFRELESVDGLSDYHDEIVRGIAWNYYAQKDWNQAAYYFGHLVQNYTQSIFHPEALLRQAESLFNDGQFEQSRRLFEILISQYPLHPEAFEARLLKARADWIRGDHDAGYNGFRDALRYAPDAYQRQRVRMIIGELQQEQEDYAAAADTFRLAFRDDPDGKGAPIALLREADNYYNLENDQDALDVYRRVIDDFPESEAAGLAQYSTGLIYFRQDRLDDYLQECLSIARRRPGTPQSALALNGAASILIERNRYSEAVDILKTLQNRYVQYLDEQLIQFRLGQTLNRAGQPSEAESVLDDLISAAPKGRYAADALMELANIAMTKSEYNKALEYMNAVIHQFPYHPRRLEAIRKSAIVSSEQQRWDESQRFWTLFIDEAGETSEVFSAHLGLAWVLFHSGNLEKAKAHAEISRRAGQRSILGETQLLLSNIIEKQGDKDEALKEYMRIGYLYPDQPEIVFGALLRAVVILSEQGKVDQAGSVLNRAAGMAESTEQHQKLRETEQLTGLSGGME